MSSTLTIRIPYWLDFIFVWPVLIYRLLRYECVFRRIYLGEEKYAIVDPKDYYRLNKYHWSFKTRGKSIYAIRLENTKDDKLKFILMHREIMKAPKGLLVDHRNGDGLDNRIANLRLATKAQNSINSRRDKTKTSSRFVGVTFDRQKNRWLSRIYINKKAKFLGLFDNELDAARAYDEAAKKYYGEFARLNLPEIKDSPLSLKDLFYNNYKVKCEEKTRN